MNERIRKLAVEADWWRPRGLPSIWDDGDYVVSAKQMQKFAELIIEDCRKVLSEVYSNTPLELCGPLLTVDNSIMNHFYETE